MDIIFSFLLYLLFITLPLIPAIMIYRFFPDTQVGAKGLLGNLKINATGAFAVYLIVAVLSFFIVQHIQGLITNSQYQTWTVKGKLIYQDSEGNVLSHQEEYVNLTTINLKPGVINKSPDYVKFLATGKGRSIDISFISQKPGFENRTIDLSNVQSVDEVNRAIELGEVVMKALPPKKSTQAGPPVHAIIED